jgi:hypothetical protein
VFGEHECPPFLTGELPGRTVRADSSVLDFPSIRTVTFGAEEPASAAPAEIRTAVSASSIAPKAILCLWCMRATPFHEGFEAVRSELVSWLTGLPVTPSRRLDGTSGLLQPASPITVAGPHRNLTGFPSLPTSDARDPSAGSAPT